MADPVQPDAGRQREQQVRQQPDRQQRAHLRRVRAQHEDGDKRQAELRDLVAEDRDGLARTRNAGSPASWSRGETTDSASRWTAVGADAPVIVRPASGSRAR